MRPISIITSLLLFSFTLQSQPGPVNAVLGDTSWFELHGEFPSSHENEIQRINTHLDYVIALLKSHNAPDPNFKTARELNILHLEEYRSQQVYPQDFKILEERTPCFIDDKGRLCAVGYLIDRSSSREDAEYINSKYRYDYLLDMEDDRLSEWQKSSGLSNRELAMIQPTYGMPPPRQVYVDPKTKKVGIRDRYFDRILVKPKYEAIKLGAQYNNQFEGLELAKYKGKWGLLTGKGRRLTKFIYDSIQGTYGLSEQVHRISMDRGEDRSSEYVFAYKDNDLDIYDKYGRLKFSYPKIWITNYSPPYLVARRDSLSGLLDTSFKWLVKPKYQLVDPLSNFSNCPDPVSRQRLIRPIKFIKVKGPEGFGLIDINGKLIIPMKHHTLFKIRPNTWVGRSKVRYHAYKESGLESGIENLVELKMFGRCEDYLQVGTVAVTPKGPLKKGILDSSFNWIVAPNYDDVMFQDGLIQTWNGKAHQLFNLDGSVYIEGEFEMIIHRKEGKKLVKMNGKLGLIDKNLKPIIPIEYDRLSTISRDSKTQKDCLAACKDGYCQIMDGDGNLISDQKFDTLVNRSGAAFMAKLDGIYYMGVYEYGNLHFNTDVSFTTHKIVAPWIMAYDENGKKGFWRIYDDIDAKENKLSAAIFDEIYPLRMYQNRRFLVKVNGLYGISDYNGNIITEPQFVDFQDTKLGYGVRYSICLKNKEGSWFSYNASNDEVRELNVNQQKDFRKKWGK